MRLKRIVIIGAGGQARETRWILEAMNAVVPTWQFLGLVVSDLNRLSPQDSTDLVLGDYRWLTENRKRVDALAIGIGTPRYRLKVAEELEGEFGPEYWPVLRHPSALFDRTSASVGRGVLIHPGVVGTVNLNIGDFAMVNNGCTLGHESSIGAGSVVNPGANVGGGVQVGRGVLIGTGAQILQYRRIGDGATVGAGAVVTHDIEPGATVVGVPARPMPLRSDQ